MLLLYKIHVIATPHKPLEVHCRDLKLLPMPLVHIDAPSIYSY